jgi:predicted AlkP superfamily pyrophosphatase or phosphodiesterase
MSIHAIRRVLSAAVMLSCSAMMAAQEIAPVMQVANPPSVASQQAKHYVVLVSLDGFRYDYARKWGAPHLDAMAEDGASTPEGMRPSYPSTTFPNHYALVSGIRPEHSGIVAMEFDDPFRDYARYQYTNDEATGDGSWYSGTPLWVLAEQQGMRSACFFWPTSNAAIQGVRPSYWLKYDDHFDAAKRVDQVAAWLALPAAERPHFITLYYPDTDHAGHSFGPDSTEERDAVHELDAMVGLLREKLKASGLSVDLIVTADHGMIAINHTPVVLSELVDLQDFKSAGMQMYAPSEAEAERVYEQLRALHSDKFEVYRRADVPEHLHYRASAREGDPVVVAKGPNLIYVKRPKGMPKMGSHGFDPATMHQMNAIFYAEGPDIRSGVKLQSFDNVDVYDFIAKLLALDPAPNDGELAPLLPALK